MKTDRPTAEGLLEKYTAWNKHHAKYSAKQVLEQIIADLNNTAIQHESGVQERYDEAKEAGGLYIMEHMGEDDMDLAKLVLRVAKIASGLPPKPTE